MKDCGPEKPKLIQRDRKKEKKGKKKTGKRVSAANMAKCTQGENQEKKGRRGVKQFKTYIKGLSEKTERGYSCGSFKETDL